MSAALEALGSLAQFIAHKEFTKVQESTIPALLSCNDNVVVAAPTGSGKTMLLEVAMLKLFKELLLAPRPQEASGNTAHVLLLSQNVRAKAVYICPIKALANEKYHHWSTMFAPLSVVIETGDQGSWDIEEFGESSDPFTAISSADIIITTPERWDSITRRWKEKTVFSLVNSVALLLLDEVHTVHEERGAALEAVVSRMKAIKAATLSSGTAQQSQLSSNHAGRDANAAAAAPLTGKGESYLGARFIAISGTLPNVRDVAEWLQVPPHLTFSYSPSDRPVPLTVHVQGFPSSSNNPFAFYRFLSFKLFGAIRTYGDGKPTLVFCASRKETESSAQRLVSDIQEAAARENRSDALTPSPEVHQLATQAGDRTLRACLLIGIGFHHAAMTMNDRHLVERMFREQYVAVVCTTSTLALGVNLPAHLVIVKGTTTYKKGLQEDMPLSEVAQMCGRAGRPGFDDSGTALILTTESKASLYRALAHGDAQTTVESQLHRNMIEHVNAEVALHTINSFASGVEWVKTTFFWIRLRRHPQYYGLTFSTKADERAFDANKYVERLMQHVMMALRDAGCITIHTSAQGTVTSDDVSPDRLATCQCSATRIGRSMARLYILFGTVQTFNTETQRQLGWKEGKQMCCVRNEMTEEENGEKDEGNGADDGQHDEQTNTAIEEKGAAATSTSVGESHAALTFKLSTTLTLLCQTEELAEIHVRQGDKGHLNELNKAIRYPLKSGKKGGREVREDWHKAYVLIQAQLSQLPLTDISLRNDSLRLWAAVPRVCRFLYDFAAATRSYSFTLHADVLLRCVERKLWPDSPLLLRQLDGVSDAVAKSLSTAGCSTFNALREADPRRLEVLCERLPPFGTHLKCQMALLPKCELTASLTSATTLTSVQKKQTCCSIAVTVTPVSKNEGNETGKGEGKVSDGGTKPKGSKKSSHAQQYSCAPPLILLAGHALSDAILILRFIPATSFVALSDGTQREAKSATPLTFTFTVPYGMSGVVIIHLNTERWLGNDISTAVILPDHHLTDRSCILASMPAPGTAESTVQRQSTLSAFRSSKAVVPAAAAAPPSRAQAPGDGSANTRESDARIDEAGAAIACDARNSYVALLEDMRYIEGVSRRSSMYQGKRQRHEEACEKQVVSMAERCMGTLQEVPPKDLKATQGSPTVSSTKARRLSASVERSASNRTTARCSPPSQSLTHYSSFSPPAAAAITAGEHPYSGVGDDGDGAAVGVVADVQKPLNRVLLRPCESPEPQMDASYPRCAFRHAGVACAYNPGAYAPQQQQISAPGFRSSFYMPQRYPQQVMRAPEATSAFRGVGAFHFNVVAHPPSRRLPLLHQERNLIAPSWQSRCGIMPPSQTAYYSQPQQQPYEQIPSNYYAVPLRGNQWIGDNTAPQPPSFMSNAFSQTSTAQPRYDPCYFDTTHNSFVSSRASQQLMMSAAEAQSTSHMPDSWESAWPQQQPSSTMSWMNGRSASMADVRRSTESFPYSRVPCSLPEPQGWAPTHQSSLARPPAALQRKIVNHGTSMETLRNGTRQATNCLERSWW